MNFTVEQITVAITALSAAVVSLFSLYTGVLRGENKLLKKEKELLKQEKDEKDNQIKILNDKIDSLKEAFYDLALISKTQRASTKNRKIDEILERVKRL